MALSRSEEQDYLDELYGRQCFCGSRKKSSQTFCSNCYFRLPNDMRKALYRRFGHGYESAVDRAKEYLR